jgi:opacity protein-like surface antigen
MNRLLTSVLIGAAVAAAAIPASAHHAVQTVFDLNKPVTVTGSITSVEWVNPHSYITLDVKGDKDAVQHWLFELPGSGGVRQLRAGLADRGGLKPGDIVTIEGIAAKDGTTTGFAYRLRVADGSRFDLSNKQPHAR